MAKFATYLFDWDGTLADTLSVWVDVYQRYLRHYGVDATQAEVGQWAMGDYHFEAHFGVHDVDAVKLRFEAEGVQKLKTVGLIPGALNLIKRLHNEGAQLAIVTTSNPDNLQIPLKSSGLGIYFHALVCGTDVQNHKPAPDSVLLAMQKIHADPASTVMVGDTDKDVLAAKSAGIKSILVHTPGYHDQFYDYAKLVAAGPDQIVGSLSEVE